MNFCNLHLHKLQTQNSSQVTLFMQNLLAVTSNVASANPGPNINVKSGFQGHYKRNLEIVIGQSKKRALPS